jgi:hypothetical protein
MRLYPTARARLARTALIVLCASIAAQPAFSADHRESPATRADNPADIADVYAWHDADRDRLVTVVTVAGLQDVPGHQSPTFDEDVIYVVNIDNNGDYVPDTSIEVRFVRNLSGHWRMLVQDLPGAPSLFLAPTEHRVRVNSNTLVYAGLRDDPFFFDFEGFVQTLQTATLSFDSNRDSFAGFNVTAIALEMPLSRVCTSGDVLHIWAETARRSN